MAVDSQAKRMSCIGVGLPVPSLLPIADNAVGAPDRLHLCWLYAGIAASAPVVAVSYILSGIVNIRLIASDVAAIIMTAAANVAIRITAEGDTEL